MNLLTGLLNQLTDGNNLSDLSKKTNINKSSLQGAIQAGLPAILEGLNQNSNNEEGAKSLDKALEKHDTSLLGHLGDLDLEDGSKIIGHIFGDNTKTVEKELSKETGLNSSQTSDLLSALAPILMGAIGQQKKEEHLDASGVSNLTTTLIGSFLSDGGGSGNILGLVTGLLGSGNGSDDSIVGNLLDKLF